MDTGYAVRVFETFRVCWEEERSLMEYMDTYDIWKIFSNGSVMERLGNIKDIVEVFGSRLTAVQRKQFINRYIKVRSVGMASDVIYKKQVPILNMLVEEKV